MEENISLDEVIVNTGTMYYKIIYSCILCKLVPLLIFFPPKHRNEIKHVKFNRIRRCSQRKQIVEININCSCSNIYIYIFFHFCHASKLVNVMSEIKWNGPWVYFLPEAAVCNKAVSVSN